MIRGIEDMSGSLDLPNFTEEIKIMFLDMSGDILDSGELFYFPY